VGEIAGDVLRTAVDALCGGDGRDTVMVLGLCGRFGSGRAKRLVADRDLAPFPHGMSSGLPPFDLSIATVPELHTLPLLLPPTFIVTLCRGGFIADPFGTFPRGRTFVDIPLPFTIPFVRGCVVSICSF